MNFNEFFVKLEIQYLWRFVFCRFLEDLRRFLILGETKTSMNKNGPIFSLAVILTDIVDCPRLPEIAKQFFLPLAQIILYLAEVRL